MTSLWTPRNTETATSLWQGGHSASEIARALGCTRNAVIGKMSRLGLTGRSKSHLGGLNVESINRVRRRDTRRKAPEPDLQDLPSAAPALPSTEAKGLTPKQIDPPYEDCIHLLDLKLHHCRYPIGSPVKFCGRRKEQGSYCRKHAELCYRKPDPSKRWAKDDPRRNPSFWTRRAAR